MKSLRPGRSAATTDPTGPRRPGGHSLTRLSAGVVPATPTRPMSPPTSARSRGPPPRAPAHPRGRERPRHARHRNHLEHPRILGALTR